MPESPPPQSQGEGRRSYTDHLYAGHLREVRVQYGLATVTVSVVETIHTGNHWQGQSQLLAIKQFTVEEFSANPRSILDAYVTELLAPVWRLTEGASGGATR